MNGELAQVIALITFGNDFLSSSQFEPPELFTSHSTFQFVWDVSFRRQTTKLGLFKRQETIATDTATWFTNLKSAGVKKLRLASTSPPTSFTATHLAPVFGLPGGLETLLILDREIIPPQVVCAFAGGNTWVTQADSGNVLWRAKWSIDDVAYRNQDRFWSVEYCQITEKPREHKRRAADGRIMESPEVREMKEIFADVLSEAKSFSERANLDDWSEEFGEAIRLLSDASPEIPYHPDLLPDSFHSLSARQLLASACKAWVFGGMGSWNDLGGNLGCRIGTAVGVSKRPFTDSSLNTEYDSVSFNLFQAIMYAILAAVNVSDFDGESIGG